MNNAQYTVEGTNLRVGNVDVNFEHEIVKVLEIDAGLLVLVEPNKGVIHNENVYLVASDGRIIWQVPKRPTVYDDSPYVEIEEDKSGALILRNWDGGDIFVSTVTWQVIKEQYTK